MGLKDGVVVRIKAATKNGKAWALDCLGSAGAGDPLASLGTLSGAQVNAIMNLFESSDRVFVHEGHVRFLSKEKK